MLHAFGAQLIMTFEGQNASHRRLETRRSLLPGRAKVPLLRALWSHSDGIWGISKCGWAYLQHEDMLLGTIVRPPAAEPMSSMICVLHMALDYRVNARLHFRFRPASK